MGFFDDLKKKLEGGLAQANPFDGGKTYSSVVNTPTPTPTPTPIPTPTPTPTPKPGVVQHASVFHDLTHNVVSNFLGGAVKAPIQLANTGNLYAHQLYDTGRQVAANATDNPAATQNANRAIEGDYQRYGGNHGGFLNQGSVFANPTETQSGDLTTGLRRIGGATLQTAALVAAPGVSKAAEGAAARILPSAVPKLLPKVIAGAVAGAPTGAAFNAGSLIQGDTPLTKENLTKALGQGAAVGALFNAGGEVASTGLAGAASKVAPAIVDGAKNTIQAAKDAKRAFDIRTTPKIMNLHPNERYVLSDYADYVGGRYKPENASVVNQLQREARTAAQKAGIDITSGSPAQRQGRIADFLDIYDRQRKLASQGGYVAVPGAGRELPNNAAIDSTTPNPTGSVQTPAPIFTDPAISSDASLPHALSHFTLPEIAKKLQNGEPFDYSKTPIHGTGGKDFSAKTSRLVDDGSPALYLSLDDKKWNTALSPNPSAETVDISGMSPYELRKFQAQGGHISYNYETQKYEGHSNAFNKTPLQGVKYYIDPSARKLVIDSPQKLNEISRSLSVHPTDPTFWTKLRSRYDVVDLTNVDKNSQVSEVENKLARQFFRAAKGDQSIVLNPDVASLKPPARSVVSEPAPSTTPTIRIRLGPNPEDIISVTKSQLDALQQQLEAESQSAAKPRRPSTPEVQSLEQSAPRPYLPDMTPPEGMAQDGSIRPTTIDHIMANTTGITPEQAATERIRQDLMHKHQQIAERAVVDHLRSHPDPQGEAATTTAKDLYKTLMNRKNGGEAEAARLVKRIQENDPKAAAKNPIKIDLPEVNKGDYARARTNPQTVRSLVQNRLAQVLPAVNRLTDRDKLIFWKAVENPAAIKDAADPKEMAIAVQRWRDLADTIHASSQALGGNTKYIANYARHNWDLTDPEQAVRFEQLLRERGGAGHDPYSFGGVNRQPRTFDSIAQGEAAGFKLKNENPAADILGYANGASNALAKQALSKGFTEADMAEPLKNRAYDLRDGFTLPLSERGLKEIKGYEPTSEPNAIHGAYRAVNRAAKQTLLSLSLFHPLNINVLQAFPTLVARGHPGDAAAGLGRSWAALFHPKFSETLQQHFLEDGTTEWAAKMGTPLRQGSDFTADGKLNVGTATKIKSALKHPFAAFERAIFDRSISAMQGTMVQAARKDLENRGLGPDSPEALQLGLEINKIMGFVNKEVENRAKHGNTVSSDLLLAPQFTRAKWSVLKDAFTKGGLAGGYARSAVVGKYVMEATLAIAAGALVKQKSDSLRDILLRELVHPSIATPFKDNKGNNIKLSEPQNYISEALGLAADLNRGNNGRIGVTAQIKKIPSNLENYGRSRLSVLPAAVLKAATNTNFAGQPVRDTSAPVSTQAIQALLNTTNDVLPIGFQGITQLDAVRKHLPQTARDALKVSSSGGNPIVKSLLGGLGFTPGNDQTVGKGLQQKQYYDALDEAKGGLNRQEKDALDLYTGSKKNPVTGKYQINPTAYDTPTNATVLLQNPRVLERLREANQKLRASGQSIDPLWDLPTDQIAKYEQYQTFAPGSADKTDWINKNESWYKPLSDARTSFFDSLPPGDPNKPKLDIQYPDPSPEVKGLLDQYGSITDPVAKGQFLDAHPEVLQQFDKVSQYTNQLRQARGYAALKEYPKPSAALNDYMTKYNSLDKGSRKSLRNANPASYQKMIAYYDSLDLYGINKQGSVNQLQGEPDSTSKQNKEISSLSQDIYKGPDGSYSIVPAGWMQGLTNGAGGYGSGSSKSGLINTSTGVDALRKLLTGTQKAPTAHYRLPGSAKPRIRTATIHSQSKGYTNHASTKAALKRLLERN